MDTRLNLRLIRWTSCTTSCTHFNLKDVNTYLRGAKGSLQRRVVLLMRSCHNHDKRCQIGPDFLPNLLTCTAPRVARLGGKPGPIWQRWSRSLIGWRSASLSRSLRVPPMHARKCSLMHSGPQAWRHLIVCMQLGCFRQTASFRITITRL